MAVGDPVRDFLLDDNGDMAVVNGDFATVSKRQAVVQGIKVRVRMFLGECFLDESQGVDWLGQIISVKNPDHIVVRELIREAIADTPDVLQVVGSALQQLPNREASISYQVQDLYSDTAFTGEVAAP
jgi:hypothetical protein